MQVSPRRLRSPLPARTSAIIAFLLALADPLQSLAADAPGSKDHPMISRYAGSEITGYSFKEFDQYRLVISAVQKANAGGEPAMTLEGKVTRIQYLVPPGRSALEVFRNYGQALKQAGFSIVFQCADQECGRDLGHAVATDFRMHAHDKDQKYLVAKLQRPEGDVYVTSYTVRAYTFGGALKDRTLTQLYVVEQKPMQAGLVKVDAAAMARAIDQAGHIALYGIYFDSGKAALKPESRETLIGIAKVLKTNAALRLLVVGHTDAEGPFDFNIDLSKRRAGAVVQALIAEYGIAGERLKPWGVGYSAPVASNGAEAGRAKNRRVELVKQ